MRSGKLVQSRGNLKRAAAEQCGGCTSAVRLNRQTHARLNEKLHRSINRYFVVAPRRLRVWWMINGTCVEWILWCCPFDDDADVDDDVFACGYTTVLNAALATPGLRNAHVRLLKWCNAFFLCMRTWSIQHLCTHRMSLSKGLCYTYAPNIYLKHNIIHI